MGGTQHYNNNIISCAAASSKYYIVLIDDPHSRPVNDVIRTTIHRAICETWDDARSTVRQSSDADGNRRFPSDHADGNRRFPKRQTHIKHRE